MKDDDKKCCEEPQSCEGVESGRAQIHDLWSSPSTGQRGRRLAAGVV